jgi:hypothetical protein
MSRGVVNFESASPSSESTTYSVPDYTELTALTRDYTYDSETYTIDMYSTTVQNNTYLNTVTGVDMNSPEDSTYSTFLTQATAYKGGLVNFRNVLRVNISGEQATNVGTPMKEYWELYSPLYNSLGLYSEVGRFSQEAGNYYFTSDTSNQNY